MCVILKTKKKVWQAIAKKPHCERKDIEMKRLQSVGGQSWTADLHGGRKFERNKQQMYIQLVEVGSSTRMD
jgi:hypothetical protein